MAKIFFCGDIVNENNPHNFISTELQSIIKECNLSVCNFEGPIIDLNTSLINGQIHQHESTLRTLSNAGFNLLLLANNHMADYGKEGIESTIKAANKYGFETIGAGINYEQAYKYHIKDFEDTTIGILNISTAQIGQFDSQNLNYGYAWLGDYNIDTRIKGLKQKVDYLIIACHIGLEHYTIPLQEVRDLFKHYCDIGADCIIGGHPHVPQGYEHYNNSLIFYSLGNFFFPNNGKTILEQESFSIVLDIQGNSIKNHRVIFHSVLDNIITIVNNSEQSFSLVDLCNNLADPNYSILSRKMYDEAYKHYFNLYCGCFGVINETITEKIKRHLGLINKPRDISRAVDSWLKMSQCETPRYILSHYLKHTKNQYG